VKSPNPLSQRLEPEAHPSLAENHEIVRSSIFNSQYSISSLPDPQNCHSELVSESHACEISKSLNTDHQIIKTNGLLMGDTVFEKAGV
jgi:hypothetical protein